MAGDIQLFWDDVTARLRRILNADTFDRWIAGIVPLSVDETTCRLGVSNDMFCEWLANHYQDVIGNAVKEATGSPRKILFESGHEAVRPPPETAAVPVTANSHPEEREDAIPLRYNRRFTFDTFVVGENNKFAHAACSAVARMPGKAYNPLFIYGGTGLGKTHLLQAIAQDVLTRKKRARVEYVSSEEFANSFIDALSKQALPKFRQYYRNVDVLLIDDVQFFTGKERFQEEFFHTFNALYNAHKQIVLASDRPPHEINGLEKRLVSRFEGGLTTEIQAADLETRIAILRRKQEDHAIKLDDETLFFIASRIKSNIRRLEGALIRLVSYASVTSATVTRELTEQLLRPMFDEEVSNSLSIERIQKVVAEFYDVRLADMTSKRRPACIAFPRQVAMYLSRKMTDHSTPTIGEAFNRNHATILHAVDTVEKRVLENADFRQALSVLERKLKG
jgi:chromosomal replication initiator protein